MSNKKPALKGIWDTPPLDGTRKLFKTLSVSKIPLLAQVHSTIPASSPLSSISQTSSELSQCEPFSLLPNDTFDTILSTEDSPNPQFSPRFVGIAICGEDPRHRDPNKQSYETCHRITSILKTLNQAEDLQPYLVNLCEASLPSATDAELLCIHTKGYLNKLSRLLNKARSDFQDAKEIDLSVNDLASEEFDSIYMCSQSIEVARNSAGCALRCLHTVFQENSIQVAAAAIRPPGHHAEAHCAMGFCFFNNAALVAKQALEKYNLKRILIVDQDIHHGNGTQRLFWDDDRVLYFSVHRWDKGKFYPNNVNEASSSAVGPIDGPGSGKTMNVAFYDGEMGDLEYQAVWTSILLPVAQEFNPDLIILSAGFDAADGDPIGNYHVSPRCYGVMTHSLTSLLPNAKVVMLLEGGYNVNITAASFVECVRSLSYSNTPNNIEYNNWPETSKSRQVKPQALEAINSTIMNHKPYWKSLKMMKYSTVNDGKSLVTCE